MNDFLSFPITEVTGQPTHWKPSDKDKVHWTIRTRFIKARAVVRTPPNSKIRASAAWFCLEEGQTGNSWGLTGGIALQSGEVSAELEMCLSVSRASGGQTVLMLAIHSDKKKQEVGQGVEGEGSISGLIRGFRQNGKVLCLAGSQVNTGVILHLKPVMTKSRLQILSESYGQGWFCEINHFLEHKTVEGFLDLLLFDREQGAQVELSMVPGVTGACQVSNNLQPLHGEDYQIPQETQVATLKALLKAGSGLCTA